MSYPRAVRDEEEHQEEHDADARGVVPSSRELDAAYENARRVTEPLIKGLFLATAAAGAITTAWTLARKTVRKHFGAR